jgi:hypothetical protein
VGYVVLALSAEAIALAVGLDTGYLPCVTCFMLTLLTFRLTEMHSTLVLFPPLAAACVIVLLSRTQVSRKVVAGSGQGSPYLLVALVYV